MDQRLSAKIFPTTDRVLANHRNTFTVAYKGEIQDDGTMKGTVDFGGFAEGTWTGRRAPANQKEPPKQS